MSMSICMGRYCYVSINEVNIYIHVLLQWVGITIVYVGITIIQVGITYIRSVFLCMMIKIRSEVLILHYFYKGRKSS